MTLPKPKGGIVGISPAPAPPILNLLSPLSSPPKRLAINPKSPRPRIPAAPGNLDPPRPLISVVVGNFIFSSCSVSFLINLINFLKSDDLSNLKEDTDDLVSVGFIFSATVFSGD